MKKVAWTWLGGWCVGVTDRERAAEHGWALDWDLRPVKQRVFNLAERGLTEFADREDRAALSA